MFKFKNILKMIIAKTERPVLHSSRSEVGSFSFGDK